MDTLFTLLPLHIGSNIPEGEALWEVLMDLKEVVELALCPLFTEETIDYDRQILKNTFPDFQNIIM